MLLDTIHSREDLLAVPEQQLPALCEEIRQFLVQNVSRTGGHLASNLGIVETTVAIHRVFDTSRDRLVFDVGHQCYVHKMLTGRMDRFDTLRQQGGLSGFPKPCESVHDAFIAGHASNAVSVALGMARARTLEGEDYHVLALMGDGAMTGGLAYVYDADNNFDQKCNLGSVDLETVMPHSADEAELLQLIYEHYMATRSRRAYDLLNNWPEERGKFIKVFPVEYRHALAMHS